MALFSEDREGNALGFYITRVQSRAQVKMLIEERGGEILDRIVPAPPDIHIVCVVSDRVDTPLTLPDGITLVTRKYILDCILKNELLPFGDYAPDRGSVIIAPTTPQGRNAFTEQEDKALIEAVHGGLDMGYHEDSLKLYKVIAPEFPRHTAQSIRDRYLKILQPGLNNRFLASSPIRARRVLSDPVPHESEIIPTLEHPQTSQIILDSEPFSNAEPCSNDIAKKTEPIPSDYQASCSDIIMTSSIPTFGTKEALSQRINLESTKTMDEPQAGELQGTTEEPNVVDEPHTVKLQGAVEEQKLTADVNIPMPHTEDPKNTISIEDMIYLDDEDEKAKSVNGESKVEKPEDSDHANKANASDDVGMHQQSDEEIVEASLHGKEEELIGNAPETEPIDAMVSTNDNALFTSVNMNDIQNNNNNTVDLSMKPQIGTPTKSSLDNVIVIDDDDDTAVMAEAMLTSPSQPSVLKTVPDHVQSKQFSDEEKRKIRNTVRWMTEQSGETFEAVLFSLYQCEGRVSQAMSFLKTGQVLKWHCSEDLCLMERVDTRKIDDMIRNKGVDAVKLRQSFLQALCEHPIENE